MSNKFRHGPILVLLRSITKDKRIQVADNTLKAQLGWLLICTCLTLWSKRKVHVRLKGNV